FDVVFIKVFFFFFFFQAEDGIRDATVTGVQTCALPIFELCGDEFELGRKISEHEVEDFRAIVRIAGNMRQQSEREEKKWKQRHRSEERRVGKECRTRGSGDHRKKKEKEEEEEEGR